MASPQVEAAAASTRRPEDVLAARKPIERSKACPFCGEDPPLAAQVLGIPSFKTYVVGCENEDCAINPQASGRTPEDAWAKWNARPVGSLMK